MAVYALLLGASRYPRHDPDLSNPAFLRSHDRFLQYLRVTLGVDDRSVCDLFNSSSNATEQIETIDDFLGRIPPREDLLVYYVGHGRVTPQQDFLLAIRATKLGLEDATSLRFEAFAHCLRLRPIRTYIILDCCFAAEAVKHLQGPANNLFAKSAKRLFPTKGIALLAAASKDKAAIAPADLELTMFSDAMLYVLTREQFPPSTRLTLRQLGEHIEAAIKERFLDVGVRPEVHAPFQPTGDVADVPFFPSAAPPMPQVEAVINRLHLASELESAKKEEVPVPKGERQSTGAKAVYSPSRRPVSYGALRLPSVALLFVVGLVWTIVVGDVILSGNAGWKDPDRLQLDASTESEQEASPSDAPLDVIDVGDDAPMDAMSENGDPPELTPWVCKNMRACEGRMGELLLVDGKSSASDSGTRPNLNQRNHFFIEKAMVSGQDYKRCMHRAKCFPALCTQESIAWIGRDKECTELPQCTLYDHPDEAVNCLSAQRADEYCSWMGGRLPTTEELQQATATAQLTKRSGLSEWSRSSKKHGFVSEGFFQNDQRLFMVPKAGVRCAYDAVRSER